MKKSCSIIMLSTVMAFSVGSICAKPQNDSTRNVSDSLQAGASVLSDEQEKKVDKESTFDLGGLLGIVGCVGLLVSIAALAILFLEKKKSERRLDEIDDDVRKMKTVFSEQIMEIKEFAKKQDREVMAELQEELRQREEKTKEQPSLEFSNKEEPDNVEPKVEPKTYYAPYQRGYKCFNERYFTTSREIGVPFKITQISPTEAEVEVLSDYDQAYNSQVKDVCDALSGSWTEFSALAMKSPGIIRRNSDADSCWTVERKIEVILS